MNGERPASTKKRTWQKAGLKNGGKSAKSKRPALPPIKCPECASQRVWKDGVRQTKHGDVQRWLCRNCGYRFSQPIVKINVPTQSVERLNPGPNFSDMDIVGRQIPVEKRFDSFSFQRGEDVASHTVTMVAKPINSLRDYNRERQVCVSEREAKNLSHQRTRQQQAAGATAKADIQGKIFGCLWDLTKQGCYKESTIKQTSYVLHRLLKLGADLSDPETVKEILALHGEWGDHYKQVITAAYARFTNFLNIPFDKPKYRPTEKLPFLPQEKEIDALIAGAGPITSTFLKLLKETAMRSGEASNLKWTHVDFERKVVRVVPEKHGTPRELRISDQLISMIQRLPRKGDQVFMAKAKTLRRSFAKQRRRISRKLDNPRLEQIHFHTLRHWRATLEYHRTKSILHVKALLGHRNIKNTIIYTHLVNFEADTFISRVAKTAKGARALVEAGFQYVCTTPEDWMLFRKPK